jgi:hypothetical protein
MVADVKTVSGLCEGMGASCDAPLPLPSSARPLPPPPHPRAHTTIIFLAVALLAVTTGSLHEVPRPLK